MNVTQKIAFITGFALIAATGLFPPWVQSWSFVAGGEDVQFRIEPGAEGYSWIFRPPTVPAWVESAFRRPDHKEAVGLRDPDDREVTEAGVRMLRSSVRTPGAWRARVDVSRLLVEWFIVAAGVFVACVCSARAKRDHERDAARKAAAQ